MHLHKGKVLMSQWIPCSLETIKSREGCTKTCQITQASPKRQRTSLKATKMKKICFDNHQITHKYCKLTNN